jgi:hypothetical protein
MSVTSCSHVVAPQGSRFCPECGVALVGNPPKPESTFHISQQAGKIGDGQMVGVKAGQFKGSVTVVQGNVFHIQDPSPDLVAELSAFKAIQTEVKPNQFQTQAGLPAGEVQALEQDAGTLLEQVRQAEGQGQAVEQVRVGGVQFGRVEILLKQAVLLKTEADQMFLDQVRQNRDRISWSSGRVDLVDLLDGLDDRAHTAKLSQAYEVLKEAHALEPANAEVLMHMAQVVSQIDGDRREPARLLYQAQALLTPPRSQAEAFHLAQVTFLLATNEEQVHTGQLRTARQMFVELGRDDWVRQCDELLRAAAEAGYPQAVTPVQGGFQPVGTWQAEITGSGTLMLQLFPNGAMQGIQQIGSLENTIEFSGQWAFDASSQTIHLQGLVGGFLPFMLQITIQGQQGDVYTAAGSDGFMYSLRQIQA